MVNQIKQNLLFINDQISKICKIYNKKSESLNLIAVSKKQNDTKIIQAIESGCKDFGENYLQEAKEKWPAIKEKFPNTKLHFIGHLQSNKAKEAVKLFDVIHTIDSKKLALEVSKQAQKIGKNLEVFIQVNIGQEEQKDGVSLDLVQELAQYIRDECTLNLVGLMCIPPNDESPAPYFALLNKIAKENNLQKLSMGMSQDFPEAIAMSATHIRIGTAIFGKRN